MDNNSYVYSINYNIAGELDDTAMFSVIPPLFKELVENRPFIISSLTITEPTMSILSGTLDFVFKCPNLATLRFRDARCH